MPYIGNNPTDVPLTSAQIADGTIQKVDLAADAGGGRNLIINGGFQVNQRLYVSTTATADGVYMHDRWRSGSTDSSYTFSTASPASPQTITIAANDSIEQVIEDVNINTAGTHTISWTGTATARAVVNTQTMSGNFAVSPIQVTAVLNQVITIQFTGADAAGGSTEATDTGTLGKVQCELGTTASDFEYEDYGTTLRKCQRYYEVAGQGIVGIPNSSTAIFALINFKVAKRASPTLTLKITNPTCIQWSIGNQVATSASIASASTNETGSALLVDGFTGVTTGSPGGFVDDDTFQFTSEL